MAPRVPISEGHFVLVKAKVVFGILQNCPNDELLGHIEQLNSFPRAWAGRQGPGMCSAVTRPLAQQLPISTGRVLSVGIPTCTDPKFPPPFSPKVLENETSQGARIK